MTNTNKTIKVRFPPSPTGEWHFGNVRTFVFNYLFAKNVGGKIVMRFEDTDKARNKPEAYISQLEVLGKLGLSFDEGPYKQSERMDIYKKYLKELVEADLAYEAQDNEFGTGKVVRLRNSEKDITWNDLVKGKITINSHSFKDLETGNPDIIIGRSVEDPVYHFTVVLDDWLMEITHVLRGDDHVTSTPRQILIYEALQKLQEKRGTEEGEVIVVIPEFGHLPTILGSNGKKMGKRNGALPVRNYFERGYLADSLLNFIALMGWNPGGEQEIFTKKELVEKFSLKRVQKNPALFNENKLDFINKGHLDMLSEDEFVKGCYESYPIEARAGIDENFEKFKKIILKVYRERIAKFSEVWTAAQNGENNCYHAFSYDADFKNFDLENICFKNKNGNQTLDEAKNNLKLVLEIIEKAFSEGEGLDEAKIWTAENLKNIIWDWSATVGRGQVLHPLRMIMSLKEKSPDPFTIMDIIGKEETIRRIKNIL
jgi:glutamyl/glutaminyl-tRNA synthetase